MHYCGDELPRNTFWLEIKDVEIFIRPSSCSQPPGEDKSCLFSGWSLLVSWRQGGSHAYAWERDQYKDVFPGWCPSLPTAPCGKIRFLFQILQPSLPSGFSSSEVKSAWGFLIVAHSDTSPVSLGKHFVPIALCALLCIVKVPASHLAGHVCGCRGNNGIRICVCTCPPACTLSAGLRRLHCSFWTEHFPWVSCLLFWAHKVLLALDIACSHWKTLSCICRPGAVSPPMSVALFLVTSARALWECLLDIWVWMKEPSLAPNYFPGDLFLFGSILLLLGEGSSCSVSCLKHPVMCHPSLFWYYWGQVWEAVGSVLVLREQGNTWDPPASHKPHQNSSLKIQQWVQKEAKPFEYTKMSLVFIFIIFYKRL